MRLVSADYLRKAIAVLGCVILLGAMDAPGSAKNDQRAAAVTNLVRKGDRLPVTATAPGSESSSSKATLSTTGRPPVGCDPLFSPIADPAQARLYRRCAV